MQRNASPRLALEQRIVFDAAIGATAADTFDRHADRSEYVPPAITLQAAIQPARDARTDTAKTVDPQAAQKPVDAQDSKDPVQAVIDRKSVV